ncbi:MAG: hypothetical protein ACRDDH_12715 [Cetobacterium sp.]|uniref:hypothetical protein n=1 Tax=Cetobacterium sp. TaxID=2071632 RepID=UPI003EE45B25
MEILICRCKKDIAGFKFGVIYEVMDICVSNATLINSEGCECGMDYNTYNDNFYSVGVLNEVRTV